MSIIVSSSNIIDKKEHFFMILSNTLFDINLFLYLEHVNKRCPTFISKHKSIKKISKKKINSQSVCIILYWSKLLHFDCLKLSVFWPLFDLTCTAGLFIVSQPLRTFTYNNKYNVHTYNTRIHYGYALARIWLWGMSMNIIGTLGSLFPNPCLI